MRRDEWYLGRVTDGLRRAVLVGGVVVVAGALTVAVATFVFGIGVDRACGCPPGPQFEAETVTVNDTTAVRLTHAGGDTLRAGQLSVVAGDRRASWAERADISASAPVRAGDALTVRAVAPGTTVRLVYRLEGGGSVTLAEHTAGTD